VTTDGALRQAVARLQAAGVAEPARDARRLLAHALEQEVLGAFEGALDTAAAEAFEQALARRVAREPVSQILGYRDFWKSRFKVTADVLDPRPETETLVELALSEPFDRVLDLGTGSGAILISLLLERAVARGVGTDVSEAAVLVAGANAEALGVADRLVLPLSNWFEDVGGIYDLIVSNPPYIAASEMDCLQPEVRLHEPRGALTDEGDGLSAYRAIAAGAGIHLRPGGRLLVEVGTGQAPKVMGLFSDAGFEDVTAHRDLNGVDRVILGKKPGDNRHS
jgi:release factor glutamine methyltransferase